MPIYTRLQRAALLALPLVLACVQAHAAPLYVVTPLGSIGTSGDIRHINKTGAVVGHALGASSAANAYVSAGGSTVNLHPPGAGASYASGINDAGRVAGHVEQGGVTRAVTFANGLVEQVGGLGGVNSYAAAINNKGQVAGSAETADGNLHGFVGLPGGPLIDLGTLGGAASQATDLNESGAVVGRADVAGGSYHAFRYADSIMRDLGTLGGTFSEANGINDLGAVAGFSYMAGDGYAHAFLFEGDTMRDLSTLGGMNSFAYGVNNLGQVVGGSETAGGRALHAFVYANGSMTDLNDLIAPDLGYVLNYAADINDAGQIAAFGCNQLEQCRGFLLTLNQVAAVPLPGTPALLGLGLFGILLVRRFSRRAADRD